MREGDEVHLFLSRRRYLYPGQNVIGRAKDTDVKVDDERKDISRKHLVIELPDDELALLTDMSSFGAFVEEKVLARRRASEADWSG